MVNVLADYNKSGNPTCINLSSLTLENCDEINFAFSQTERDFLLNDYTKLSRNKKMRKYWNQRYRLFSKFDDGVLMDKGDHFNQLYLIGLLSAKFLLPQKVGSQSPQNA